MAGPPDLAAIRLSKSFGSVPAVDQLDFSVGRGEWLSLVGPSGCGKSTTLRMLAGFTAPNSGRIEIKGIDVTTTPPYRRNTGMVFQNYALFPHMTVAENIAYGLRVRRLAAPEIERRVRAALALVQLDEYGSRYPTRELSGGQQQRVALARAIVIEPDVLLLDEPLSNLDAQLREDLRVEMAELHRRLGLATIYVTHDQDEALSMSTRVAVMNRGRIEQIGSPEDIYERPATLFVADFIGKANTLKGTVTRLGAHHEAEFTVAARSDKPIMMRGCTNGTPRIGGGATVAFRSERVRFIEPDTEEAYDNVLLGSVRHIAYYGNSVRYRISIAENAVLSVAEKNTAQARYPLGTAVRLAIKRTDCLIFATSDRTTVC